MTLDGADGDHEHVIDTGKGQLLLSGLGRLLPGLAEIMPLVGDRVWRCFHAARAHNRRLAAFQLREAVALLRKGAVLRPKYAESIDEFVEREVAAVLTAVNAEDWGLFETAFAAMVDSANDYHDRYGKPFLHWRVPAAPPPDLDLTAGM